MFDLWGITFHWYGLLIGLGIVAAIEIAVSQKKIAREIVEKSAWWVIIAGLIGARLYHVIDFWEYYSLDPIKILLVWEGGLGIWGAIGGGMIGLLGFCHFSKLNFWKLMDVYIVGVPLAQIIGRIGNFVNKELYGKNGEPLFAYEGFLNLILFGILWKMSKKNYRNGTISGVYLAGYGMIRILLENLRPNESIWRVGGVPMAMVMGVIGVVTGGYLIYRKQS